MAIDEIQDLTSKAPRYRGEKKKRYEQLTELRSKLFEQYTVLYGTNIQTDHNAGEDSADVGSDNFIREVNLNVMSEEGHKLSLIEDAIKRLENNKYGKCVDCNCTIQSGRLDAIPYAKLCISCKSQREEEGVPSGFQAGAQFEKDDELTE